MVPWTTAIIDYSGANEYIDTHYGKAPSLQSISWVNSSTPYFFSQEYERGKAREPIYNGRELQIVEKSKMPKAVTNGISYSSKVHRDLLKKYGMTLVESPTHVIEWKNRKQIENVYIQELEDLLQNLFSAKIEMYCFWNPMLRGECLKLSSPLQQNHEDNRNHAVQTANVASAVHIDTDVGAYDSLEEFLAIVEANQVQRQTDCDAKLFDREKYRKEILQNNKRFAVINFWRSTNRIAPVTTSPLAILSTRYEARNSSSMISQKGSTESSLGKQTYQYSAFPYAQPDLKQSKWFAFPNMTSDELLVFYQYDRLATQPSDLWHCAISVDDKYASNINEKLDLDSNRTHAPRESFDIRALVVFDEIVQHNKDRFRPERVRPVLSFEESGCFCDEQAMKRS